MPIDSKLLCATLLGASIAPMSLATTALAAAPWRAEAPPGSADHAVARSVIIGTPLPVNLYPANCLAGGLPSGPRAPTWQSNLYLIDASQSGEAQFVATTVTVWREPCNSERSVLLLQVEPPPQQGGSLRMPEIGISGGICPVFLDAGFAQQLDNYDSRLRLLEPASTAKVFSLAVLGLSADENPPDQLSLQDCDINQPLTLRFSATTDARWTDIGNGISVLVPGENRTDSVAIAAYDPALYPEAALKDLLSGHITGSYYDPAKPGEGMLIEIAQVGNDQVFVLTWFTFDDAGNPFWLVGSAVIEPGQRTVDLQLASMRGGRFAGAVAAQQTQTLPWGNLSLAFTRCNTLEFSFASTHSSTTMPRGTGQRSWSRLTEIAQLGCD